jgi:hypothetical protein
VNLDNVSRDDWIVGGLALLLAIDLLFFPWFHISVGIGPISVSADYTATGTPDGWLGVLAVLASLAVLVDLAIERLSPQTQIPAIGGSRAMTRFVLALVAAFFMALKFLFHIHFSLFGWGFYLAVVLVAALVYFTMQARQAPAVAAPAPAAAAPPASATPVADPQATRPRETMQAPSASPPPPESSPPPPGSSGPAPN